MEYKEALAFLRELTKFGFNFGLARIEKLLDLMGNPHHKFKSVHIGGTNGKGSVCAYTSNILAAAGYKTGLFTSPHLHAYTERIKINGTDIAKEDVARLLTQMKPLLFEMVEEGYEHPTEFEVNTALAFQYFAENEADIAVVEVGLGGAIDSTNVVSPVVSAITNVTLDHLDYLGKTIPEIASVKAGIIKPGVPCVTAAKGDALRVIEMRCTELGSPLFVVGKDIFAISESEENGVHTIGFTLQDKPLPSVQTHLLGDYQVDNAAVARGVIYCLQNEGFKISEEAIKTGFYNTKWPARLEIVSLKPFVLIDAAHNHAGACALAGALKKHLPEKAVFVIGILADKERHKILEELLPYALRVIVTKPNTPRAGSWQEIRDFVHVKGIAAEVIENICDAVDAALMYGRPVVVTGSIYMVATARAHLLGIEQE